MATTLLRFLITRDSALMGLRSVAAPHIDDRIIHQAVAIIWQEVLVGYDVADEMKEFLETIKCEKMKRELL